MAVTRIWPIKGNVADVVSYACNPEKTKLSENIHGHDDISEEKVFAISCFNCNEGSIADEMNYTKKFWNKTDGVVAYHAYQSFKGDEVTPEEANRIGFETALKMFGDEYEFVVATHLNTGNIHNHIVVNSINRVDGKKLDSKNNAYRLRSISDEICKEHGLEIITEPKGKRIPYTVKKAQEKGIPTKYDYMKRAIDIAVENSYNEETFFEVLKDYGYIIVDNRIRTPTDDHAVNLKSLGENYTIEKISERVQKTFNAHGNFNYRYYLSRKADRRRSFGAYYEFRGRYMYESNDNYSSEKAFRSFAEECTKLALGSAFSGSPVGMIIAMMMLFAAVMIYAKNEQKQFHPKSYQTRLSEPDKRRLEQEFKLIIENNLYDAEKIDSFISQTETELAEKENQRDKLRNKIRACKDPTEKKSLCDERTKLTKEIAILRKKKQTAERLPADLKRYEIKIQNEKSAIEKMLERPMQKTKTKQQSR